MSAYRYITEELTVKNMTTETAELLNEVKIFFDRMCDYTKPLVADWDPENEKVIRLVEDDYHMRLEKIELTVDGETVEIRDALKIKSLSDLAQKIPDCRELSYFGKYAYNCWNDDAFDDAALHLAEWLKDEKGALRKSVTFKGFSQDDGSADGELTITSFKKYFGLGSGDGLYCMGMSAVSHIKKWTTGEFLFSCNHPADIDSETAAAINRCVMEIASYDKYNHSLCEDTDNSTVDYTWSQNAEFTREELPVFVAKLRELAELIKPVLGKFYAAGTFEADDPGNTPFAALRIDCDDYFNVRVQSALL